MLLTYFEIQIIFRIISIFENFGDGYSLIIVATAQYTTAHNVSEFISDFQILKK